LGGSCGRDVVADEEGEVVVLGSGPLLDGVDDAVGELLRRQVAVVEEELLQAGLPELFVVGIGGFEHTVGVEDETVAGEQ
jgi:hypothetical protein